jgi:hypothetical protein
VVVLIVGLGFLGGTGFILWRLVRSGAGKRRRGTSGRPSLAFYRRLDDILRKRGYRREPAVTPAEFARHVIDDGGDRYRPVAVVTEAFCRVRYGGQKLTSGERADIRHALAALEAGRAQH